MVVDDAKVASWVTPPIVLALMSEAEARAEAKMVEGGKETME